MAASSFVKRVRRKAGKIIAGEDLRPASRSEAEAKEASRQRSLRKNMQIVCEATGWSGQKAQEEMDRALELGMSYYRYAHNECWKLSDEEIKELAVKLEKRAKKRKENIEAVCEATGWDEVRAKKEVKAASAWGITSGQYVRYRMYELSSEGVQEFASVLSERKAISRKDQELYLQFLCEKTGWDKGFASERLAQAKDKGISAFKYLANSCWKYDEAGLARIAASIKKDSARLSNNKNFYVDEIAKATGWLKGKVELEVNKAKNLCGASYEDYYAYKFYEITSEEQEAYVTFGLFSKMRFKYNDRDKARALFDDKAGFNKTFADLIHRKWFTNDQDLAYDRFLANIEGLTSVLVKPLAATQGIGIQKYSCNESEEKNRQLYDALMKMNPCIVEEYIVQNKEVASYCDTSVNTVRVTTLNFNGECRFLYSVFRMGQGAVVDNFHAGGIAATVDMETGKVVTSAADLHGNTFPIHPYSGLPVKGFQVPNWDKVLEICRKATGRVPGVNLIGWDLAITEDGVDLVEGNPGASYIVAQIPCIEDRIGLRSVMVDPYL